MVNGFFDGYSDPKKRQREGIEMKKLRGEWADYGRTPAIGEDAFDAAFLKVIAGEITLTELRKELGLSVLYTWD